MSLVRDHRREYSQSYPQTQAEHIATIDGNSPITSGFHQEKCLVSNYARRSLAGLDFAGHFGRGAGADY
jgi:hypothetical protein